MSKHENWKIDHTLQAIVSNDHHIVCLLQSCTPNKKINQKYIANWNLIVAAPELLEALKEIAEGKGRYSEDQFEHARNTIEDMKEEAKLAIAKAEGN